MNGYLYVDKPLDWTSFDVVKKVRSVLEKEAGRKIKVGHSGTLDPQATGLLILALGDKTKTLNTMLKLDKTYEVEATLGAVSTTGDSEGEITKTSPNPPTTEEIETVLGQFRGEISQTPPAYSAIKVGGQRAYKLARKGKAPEIEPRQVTIHKLELINYEWPKLKLICEVSSGTYIRTLVEDIGDALMTGAYTSALRRTQIGDKTVENAVSPQDLNFAQIESHLDNG